MILKKYDNIWFYRLDGSDNLFSAKGIILYWLKRGSHRLVNIKRLKCIDLLLDFKR